MKRIIVAGIFVGIFIWGISAFLSKSKDKDLKDVGDVKILYGEVELEVKGEKIEKRYEDDITEFECSELSEIAGDLVTIKKPAKSENPEEEILVSVLYDGEFIDGDDEMIYTIYDTGYNEIKQTKTLDLTAAGDDDCYVSVDVKWGRRKNYVKLRYYFKVIK